MERAPCIAANEDTETTEEPENEPTERVILCLSLLTVGEREREAETAIERTMRKEMESFCTL